MLPEVFFGILLLGIEILILIFSVYYFLQLRNKEKTIEQTKTSEDTSYHKIVDDALNKERKILEDASMEADDIITNAKYVEQSTKEAIDHALAELIQEIQKQSVDVAHKYMTDYSDSLKKIAQNSLTDFQNSSASLHTDIEVQIKDFREKLLPAMEKELDEYRKMRLKQTEDLVTKVVEKASQEVFNKSASIEDHQKLLTDSLEKAKAEGVFN